MRYIGIAVMLAALLLFLRGYRRHLSGSAELLRGFLELIKEMRSRLNLFPEPISGWVCDFSCESLEGVGFLPALREGCGAESAWKRVAHELSSCDEAVRVLNEFFSRTGTGYLAEERLLLEFTEKRLAELVGDAQSRVRERSRVVGAVSLALSLGLAILII